MPELAYVNGRVSPIAEALVPIDDRGFLFGDAVYEALRVYSGKPFALDLHQERLSRSLAALEMKNVDIGAITQAIHSLIAQAGLAQAVLYYQVTRGVQARDHAPAAGISPTIVITLRAFARSKLLDYEQGVSTVTMPDIRWGRVDIKTTNLLPNVLSRWQAKNSGCFEAILLDGEIVREACATSVVMIKDGKWIAPRNGPWILPSITREIAEQICKREGWPCEERDFSRAEMMEADELMLLGSTTEIVGVVRVDGQKIGDGRPGPRTQSLLSLYRDEIARRLGLGREALG